MAKERKQDNTAPNIAELEAEKRKLYMDNNPKRLEQVKRMLDYLYYGIE